jgi:hypothetical protein
MDISVKRLLSIPHDSIDVTSEHWDDVLNEAQVCITETPDERRARIYPVALNEVSSIFIFS